MADPNEFDEVMPESRLSTPGERAPIQENMGMRLLWMIIISMMISLAQSVLAFIAVVQFVIMLVNKKVPNDRLAELGSDIGLWMAKAARYQSAESELKPWPWSELD